MSAQSNPFVRVALVWAAMVAIWLALPLLRSVFWGAEGTSYSLGGHVMSAVLATALAVPMVVVARRVLDKQSVASLGLRLDASAVRPFLSGAVAFLLPSALGFAIVLVLGWTSITPVASWGEILAFVPLLIVLVFIYEALPEELAFRGYIQANLETQLGYWGAIFAQAVLFALWGAALWTLAAGAVALDRLVMFFFVGLVLGLVRSIAGSVWTAIGLHVAFQTVAQTLLNTERGHFAVEGSEMMQLVALGVVPFSLAALIVEILGPKTPGLSSPAGSAAPR